jgi:UDP-N-acetylmuramoyl-L-alanyl-D-glutamate--2,6-diaminopimelate ligase
MTLAALLERLSQADLIRSGSEGGGVRAGETTITSVTSDSRKAKPGALFVAVVGTEADGHAFAAKAAKAGAVAVVAERAVDVDVPVVQVTSSRSALAHAAALLHGDPARELELMGVTGTNGKTTTSFLLHQMTEALGVKTGLIGTIETRIGEHAVPATHTTPGSEELHLLLRRMQRAGCTHVAMEVSSHALDQERVGAVPFAAAVFTNLTREHLDYHGTMDAYRAAKRRLFERLAPDAVAAVNADDASRAAMADAARQCGARVITYGEGDADVRFSILDRGLSGLTLELDGARSSFALVGEFNAYNLAAAYATGLGMGWDAQAVRIALQGARPVPGRFEQFRSPDGRTVIVDYAHTPDALENVLATARAAMPDGSGRLWLLFGCGGDRDAGKRRPTAQIAERYADRCVVTSDNPRTEDPEAILADIRQGFDRPMDAAWIADRREALAYAARESAPGDVILVTGKGHEDYMIVGTEKVPFDDRAIVRDLFGITP